MAGVENSTITELSALKESYGSSCRVIQDCGEFSHMVTIRLKNSSDVTLKFQLTESYPDEAPQVIVISSNRDSEKEQLVQHYISSRLEEFKEEHMLTKSLQMLEEWLDKGKQKTFKNDKTVKEEASDKQKKKKLKEKNKEDLATCDSEKKSSMKTAEDVISRILWDSDLLPECFTIGYLDRFTGIVEKAFEAFSWEDIATVDYDTLAIPKHRIQYFKYKDEIVWDKTKRLDNVFGSTGSGLTVIDVIRRYENSSNADRGRADVYPDSNRYDEGEDIKSTDINGTKSGKQFAELKTDYNDAQEKIEAMDFEKSCLLTESSDEEVKKWDNKARPNYFVAIRVTNPDVLLAVTTVQQAVVQLEPRYDECMIPQRALHVTLCTLRLNTAEQITDAVRCLNSIKDDLKRILSDDNQLELKDVNCFRDRVLHVKVQEKSSLLRFADHVKLSLQACGFEIKDFYSFTPHMTIAKISHPIARTIGTRQFDERIYYGLDQVEFGCQTIDSIHLCSMMDERREDGFYRCATSISLDKAN